MAKNSKLNEYKEQIYNLSSGDLYMCALFSIARISALITEAVNTNDAPNNISDPGASFLSSVSPSFPPIGTILSHRGGF